jgi:hypothetical protein
VPGMATSRRWAGECLSSERAHGSGDAQQGKPALPRTLRRCRIARLSRQTLQPPCGSSRLLRLVLAAVHLLALGIGLAAIWARGRALRGIIDNAALRRAFAAVEANDVDTYVSFFTDDAVYQAANFPPVIGPEGIRQFATPVMETFSRVTHDVKAMWEPERDVVIAEVILRKADGSSVMDAREAITAGNIAKYRVSEGVAQGHLLGRQPRLGRRQGWNDDQRSDEDECAHGGECGGGREDARAMAFHGCPFWSGIHLARLCKQVACASSR